MEISSFVTNPQWYQQLMSPQNSFILIAFWAIFKDSQYQTSRDLVMFVLNVKNGILLNEFFKYDKRGRCKKTFTSYEA